MADEKDTPDVDPGPKKDADTDVEKQAFLERLGKESTKRKEAEQHAQKVEKDLADIRAEMEQRDQQGLPELDQLKKRLEAAEKRAEEADGRAQQFERQATDTRREQWVTAAASSLNFKDPADAVRYLDDLSQIETAEDAERAVKKVAKGRDYLVKDDDPQLPGRVLENGRAAPAPAQQKGNIDLDDEAQMISDNLQKFLKGRT